MDYLEKTEAQKNLEAERQRLRRQRISQVREQTNTWASKSRKRFEDRKSLHLKELISQVTADVTDEAVRNLEELSRVHSSVLNEIGAAHRAAASYPDFQGMKEVEQIENNRKAEERYVEAMKKKKSERKQREVESRKLQQVRQTVRADENLKSKLLVDRRPFRPRNVQRTQETLKAKLRREGYQQSLAKKLYIPERSTPSAAENAHVKNRSKRKASVSIRKKSPVLSRKKGPFAIAAEARAAGTHFTRRHTSPHANKKTHRLRMKSPEDVLFVNARIPLPPQKYKPPAGLTVRIPFDPSVPSAWDTAEIANREKAETEAEDKVHKKFVSQRTKARSKKALKRARLEQRYKVLATELMSTISEDDEAINASSTSQAAAEIVGVTESSTIKERSSETNYKEQFENLMKASASQMKSLVGQDEEETKLGPASYLSSLEPMKDSVPAVIVVQGPRRISKSIEMGKLKQIAEVKKVVLPTKNKLRSPLSKLDTSQQEIVKPASKSAEPVSHAEVVVMSSSAQPERERVEEIESLSVTAQGRLVSETSQKDQLGSSATQMKTLLNDKTEDIKQVSAAPDSSRNEKQELTPAVIIVQGPRSVTNSTVKKNVVAQLREDVLPKTKSVSPSPKDDSIQQQQKITKPAFKIGEAKKGSPSQQTNAISPTPPVTVVQAPRSIRKSSEMEKSKQFAVTQERKDVLAVKKKSDTPSSKLEVSQQRLKITKPNSRSGKAISINSEAVAMSSPSRPEQETLKETESAFEKGMPKTKYTEQFGQLTKASASQMKTFAGVEEEDETKHESVVPHSSRPESMIEPTPAVIIVQAPLKVSKSTELEKYKEVAMTQLREDAFSNNKSVTASSKVESIQQQQKISKPASKNGESKKRSGSQINNVIPPEVADKTLRHFIGKLLTMRPASITALQTSQMSSSVSSLSNTSLVRISSSMASTASGNSSSGSLNGTREPYHSPFTQHVMGASLLLPLPETSTPIKSKEQKEESYSSSLSSDFPEVNINVVYDTSENSLGSTVQGPSSSENEICQLLQGLCLQQVHCLSTTPPGTSAHQNASSKSGSGSSLGSIGPLSPRIAQILQWQGSAAGSESPLPSSADNKLRGGISGGTKHSSLSFRVSSQEFLLSTSPLNISSASARGEPFPPMIGKVADQWAQISIQPPQWLVSPGSENWN